MAIRLSKIGLMGILFLFLCACGRKEAEETINKKPACKDPVYPNNIYKGADISWVTEMEDAGVKFYNGSGNETDCFAIMKEWGMNAIRLRVWVNPGYHMGAFTLDGKPSKVMDIFKD